MPSSGLAPRNRTAVRARAVNLLAHNVSEHWAILLTGLVGSVLMAGFGWASGEVYESLEDQGRLVRLDRPVLDWMIAHRSPGLNEAVTAWTTVGGPIVSPIVALVVGALLAWRWRTWLPVLFLVVAGSGALAVTIVGKNYVGRVRPPHELAVAPYEWSPSFPSGHALTSLVIGGAVAYLLWQRWDRAWAKVLVVLLAGLYTLAMGVSRVYLGHHWLSDVLVGWAVGAAWLAAVITGHRLAVEVGEHRRAELEGRVH